MLRCEEDRKPMQILVEESPSGCLSLESDESGYGATEAAPDVSLGYLLDRGYLKTHFKSRFRSDLNYFLPSDRARLYLNLALSLLQLSHGDWRQVEWNAESIFFLKDPSSGNLSNKRQPYLTWALEAKPEATDPGDPDTQKTAMTNKPTCDPHLLHFARLIMEIHAGEKIDSVAKGRSLQMELQGQIEDEDLYLSPQDDAFVGAVSACLGNEGREAAEDSSDPERMRVFIFSNIVQNLSSNVRGGEHPLKVKKSFLLQSPADVQGKGVVSPYHGDRYDQPEGRRHVCTYTSHAVSMSITPR
jgi:hypothetical protein